VSAGSVSPLRLAIASSVSGWIVASRWTWSSIFGYGVTEVDTGRDRRGRTATLGAMAPPAPALAVRGLGKRYGRLRALDGVDLEVGEGELVGLHGPTGAGKSTLVKIACGLVRPTEGAAEICGAAAGSAPARRVLGYPAELFRFPGWYSADEVLQLHQRLAGSTGGADERRELLGLVALADARDRRVEDMSKGMQQRLGIAQALVGSPRMLVPHQPTTALHPARRPG